MIMKKLHKVFHLFFATQVTIFICARAAELGSSCNEDSECHVENSRCYQKLCSCLPYYAAYNSTVCLQSNMLGFECVIPEQCSKKVANSSCIGGICRCEPGFLQFRRHTCLTAAKVGEICYNDMHCRLWDGGSHCDFMIANLFGRCVCNAPLKQSRAGTCLPSVPATTTTTTAAPVELTNKTANKNLDQTSITGVNLKVQSSQKTPSKVKPSSNDYKLINSTEKPDHPVKKGQKPHRPQIKPEKLDQKPQNKPDRPAKPEQQKPAAQKKPDHKFQLSQFLNKTYFHDENIFQSLLNMQKFTRHPTAAMARPSVVTTPKSSAVSPTKPVFGSNFFLNLQQSSKPNKQSTAASKNETHHKHQSTEATKPTQDKILVVSNNSGHIKKPSKNKGSGGNKTSFKTSFQSTFSFAGKENGTGNQDESKYPVNLNKQIENTAKTVANSNLKENTPMQNISAASLTGPLHHRGAEDGLNNAISLGYACKNDLQCMKSDNSSRCINGVCDCVARRTRLENSCSAKNKGCHKGTFQCKSTGVCISWFFVCDGRKDCADGSDEDCKDRNTCPEHAFRCGSAVPAVCISQASRCDGTSDCPNGEDEHNCTTTKYTGCPLHTFQCGNGRCLPEYEFCNAVISCPDGTDEPDNSCTATWTTSLRSLGHCPFRCSNGRCRSSAVVCSGRDGCGDNSDENKCSVCRCPPII